MNFMTMFFLALFPLFAFAEDLPCSRKGTQVLYLNGVLNTDIQAETSKIKIEELMKKIHPSGKTNAQALVDKNKVEVDFMYNESMGLIDFYETAAQKFKEAGIKDPWPLLANVTWNIFDNSLTFAQKLIVQAVIPDLQAGLIAGFEDFENNQVNQTGFFKYHVENYLKQGKKVIVVSHSQGNLFANEVNDALFNNPEVSDDLRNKYTYYGNLQVASAAGELRAKNSEYITAKEDGVINYALRTASNGYGGNVLPANYDITQPFYKFWVLNPFGEEELDLGHDFARIYLSQTLTADSIKEPTGIPKTMEAIFLENLNKVALKLRSNCCELADGTISDEEMKLHMNRYPDGSYLPGGLVSVKSTVGEYAFIAADAFICGESTLSNFVYVFSSDITDSQIASAHKDLPPEEFYEPLQERFGITIDSSTIKNSSINGFPLIRNSIVRDSSLNDATPINLAAYENSIPDRLPFDISWRLWIYESEIKNGTRIIGPLGVERSTLDKSFIQNVAPNYNQNVGNETVSFTISTTSSQNSDIILSGEGLGCGVSVKELVNMRIIDSGLWAHKVEALTYDPNAFVKSSYIYAPNESIAFASGYKVYDSSIYNKLTVGKDSYIESSRINTVNIGQDVNIKSSFVEFSTIENWVTVIDSWVATSTLLDSSIVQSSNTNETIIGQGVTIIESGISGGQINSDQTRQHCIYPVYNEVFCEDIK